MIHTGGEQIQGNETRNVRDWGPRLGENRGGRVGKLDSTSSLRLDKDPRWAREVGNVRLYSCRSSVCWRVIHAPRPCTVLGCWRQGVAWQQSLARCLLLCIRALREKQNFQLFHFVQPLKMVHFGEIVTVEGLAEERDSERTREKTHAFNQMSTSATQCAVTLQGERPLKKGTDVYQEQENFWRDWKLHNNIIDLLSSDKVGFRTDGSEMSADYWTRKGAR